MGSFASAIFMYKILVLWVAVFFFDNELKKQASRNKGLVPVKERARASSYGESFRRGQMRLPRRAA
jgi:hypothetical protein